MSKRDFAAKRDTAIKRKQTRYETNIKKADKRYNAKVKHLTLATRSPVFILKSFNQPDWGRCKDMLVNKKARRIKERPTRLVEKWKTPVRWRKLKINMTVKQVHALLGEPEKSKTDAEGTREYYGDAAGHGELYLSTRSDLKEYLDSWTEPFWPAVEKSLLAENKSGAKP